MAREPEVEDVPPEKPVARGLHLPTGALGVPASEQKSIHEQWNTLDEVEAEIASKGLVAVDRPSFDYPGPVTPAQLTTTLNKDYSELYAYHLGWYNFVSITLARVKAMLLQLDNEMTDIETRIRKELKEKNRRIAKEERFNEKDITDATNQDQRYRELTLQKQRFDQKKIEYDAYLDCMDRNLRVISRQVEIRRIEMEAGGTSNAMPHRGRPPLVRGPG